MQNRRTILVSAGALLVMPRLALAAVDASDMPHATAEPGKPPHLDFGDGLKVPLNRDIFLTLWEGKTFWITYGYGRAEHDLTANSKAEHFAEGAMKALLLTLAFEPGRLDHVDGCGWRLKDLKARNYVLGDIDLPGRPARPVSDADRGYGSADSSVLNGSTNMAGSTLQAPGEAAPGGQAGYGIDMTGSFTKLDAFTAYIVMKKDVDLDYVRANAQLL